MLILPLDFHLIIHPLIWAESNTISRIQILLS